MNKRPLPSRPNMQHLRKQAKALLAALHAGDAASARVVRDHLPTARGQSLERIRAASYRLADAQLAIARHSGFASWPSLARHVEELRSLEGHWAYATLEIDGAPVEAALIAEARLLIDGDRFRMESADGDYEGVFTIDVEPEAHAIDIEFVDGPEAGKWSYGIYRVDGEALTMCLGLVGFPRPTGFVTTRGSGHALERLRRADRARPDHVDGGTAPAAVAPPAPVTKPAGSQGQGPELERLQGEWLPTLVIRNGAKLPEAMLRTGKRVARGDDVRVTFGGHVMLEARVHIDATQAPIAVDYLLVGGSSGGVQLGIMESTEACVRFCFAAVGVERPKAFTSAAGSGYTLSEWRLAGEDRGPA